MTITEKQRALTNTGIEYYIDYLKSTEEEVPPLFPKDNKTPIPENILKEIEKSITPYDENVNVRDIRLLGSEISPNELIYILVLEKKDDNYIIAPFSLVSFPIFDGEILVGKHAYISVLQTWLTIEVPAKALKISWKISTHNVDIEKAIEHYNYYIKKNIKNFKYASETGITPTMLDFTIHLYKRDQEDRWNIVKEHIVKL